ncbi:uncharacterized protein LOC131041966 [Cryptomeria japonica]|uniref:uncharacterized protein LOC131041966 n=1 Tax=Cryptomeria japonica TaxID=3369 RepID=UPI0025AD1E70|nr:uncharacterized protein LOC131041966 [Cryptomeria japonica]
METFTEPLDESQVKEDEPSSIHFLSYMPPEYEFFKFHEECDKEESLGQDNTKSNADVCEQVEDEIYEGISTNVPILMKSQSMPYEVFKVQSNPPFESLNQEDFPIKEDSSGNYIRNAEINEVGDDLMKEAHEVESHHVCIPDWCLKASDDDFPYGKSVNIALQIAIALQYLHVDVEPPVLHHDVKSANVLLVDDSHAKLTDFGLPKLGHRDSWAAPTPVKGSYGIVGDDNKPQSHERF